MREMGTELITAISNKFIQKYDKNYENHAQKSNVMNKYQLINAQFIVPLEKATYMYVATGRKIGSLEARFLMNSGSSNMDLYIYIFGKKMHKYCKELDNLVYDLYNNRDIGIYTVDAKPMSMGLNLFDENNEPSHYESLDICYTEMQPRDLSTLFYSHGEKEKICSHIDRFNATETFYKERQILYKTGILLHGEPGTGKSSLIKALATKYGRNIININVSNIKHIDLTTLTQSINCDKEKKYIILLEDIDTLFLNRNKDTDKNDASVVNKLLQFLDSNTSPTDVIFVATTNHIDRLDDALLRDGRFDLKVEIKPLKKKEVIEFGESFGLSETVMEDIIKNIDESKSNINGSEYNTYNQSMIQARALSRIENKSVEKVVELYGEMEDAGSNAVDKEDNGGHLQD